MHQISLLVSHKHFYFYILNLLAGKLRHSTAEAFGSISLWLQGSCACSAPLEVRSAGTDTDQPQNCGKDQRNTRNQSHPTGYARLVSICWKAPRIGAIPHCKLPPSQHLNLITENSILFTFTMPFSPNLPSVPGLATPVCGSAPLAAALLSILLLVTVRWT